MRLEGGVIISGSVYCDYLRKISCGGQLGTDCVADYIYCGHSYRLHCLYHVPTHCFQWWVRGTNVPGALKFRNCYLTFYRNVTPSEIEILIPQDIST